MLDMNDENGNGKRPGPLAKAAGCLSFASLQFFVLVWGAARFLGIYVYARERWNLGGLGAFVSALFLCEIPIASHILATLGGVVAYGLAWYWSALIFAPEGVFGVVVIGVMLASFPFVLLREFLRKR